MNFLIPIYLDAILMRAPTLLKNLAAALKFKTDEFISACNNRDAQKADDILTENINRLMGSDNINVALCDLAEKFPEVNINTNVTLPKEMVIRIGEHADKMLEIARGRGLW